MLYIGRCYVWWMHLLDILMVVVHGREIIFRFKKEEDEEEDIELRGSWKLWKFVKKKWKNSGHCWVQISQCRVIY